MAASASPLQIAANRSNAQLSSGPRTPTGKLASSLNAQSHGLTSRHALLPGEDPAQHQLHHQSYVDFFQPQTAIDHELVHEFSDLRWRLRRVSTFEAHLLSIEYRNLTSDPEFAPIVKDLESPAEILAVAYSRLIQSKVLTNLLNQEARLDRRAAKIHRHLTAAMASPSPIAEPNPIEDAPIENQKNEPNPAPPRPISTAKIGRNEPCPCQSGLKFKRCCLGKATAAVGASQKSDPHPLIAQA
jgi:SEC-C motif